VGREEVRVGVLRGVRWWAGFFSRECEKWIDELVNEWLFDMRRWRNGSIDMKDRF
jgi:hypothetical protein